MLSAKRSASIFESRMGLPCSLVSSRATSSRRSRTHAAACIRMCARLWPGVLLQAGKAAAAASMAPRFFSAGADINNFKNSTQEQRVMTVLHAQEILLKIERTPKVFVAAINGHALGGGLEIALACDFRFAAEGEYRMGLPEVTLGLLPGNGGTQRLTRLVGRARALDMMITNQQIKPTRALEIGLVERVFPADRLVEEAVDYVARLAKGPTLAIGNIKIATRLRADPPLEGALALEREAVWRLFMSEDAAEGLSAFTEKRAPNWKGR